MKNLLTFGLLAWVAIYTSCQKGEALNPIKLTDQTGITTTAHDSTYYVFPTGYNATNAFLAPINLGVPAYLESKNDAMSETVLSLTDTTLADRVSLYGTHPEYLASNAVNTINITSTTDIYVTFLSSNAGYKNTLAYYTYKTNNPPTANSGGSDNGAMDKITYIFPNATSQIAGGGLVAGNRVKLGSFTAGTTISFVLILKSWSGSSINTGNAKFYSQDNLNPETVTNLKRHSILLYDSINNVYIVGFEWTNRQTASSDNDFNDLVFYVKASNANSITSNNVAVVNDSGK